ncbi:MAG: magnesium transporter MgtE N-terminal domain-containing protein [Panacagrimonas sp.]
MTESLALASAFVEHEPEAAARALEGMTSEQAALLLAELPTRLSGPLLEHFTPGGAARRLAAMPSERAAAILEESGSRVSVSVLRVCPPETRRAVMSALPARLVQHVRRSMAYTPDTVGAWIDYDVPSLAAHRSVGEALQLLRQRNRPDDTQVFLLRAGHLYAGAVATPALLHVPADTPLSRLADRHLRALSDALDVDEAEQLPDWDDHALLPVTAPDGALLGALSRAGLRRALHSVFPQPASTQPDSLLAHLLSAYLHTGTELMRLVLGRGNAASLDRSGDEP